jgi:hypothetical protein
LGATGSKTPDELISGVWLGDSVGAGAGLSSLEASGGFSPGARNFSRLMNSPVFSKGESAVENSL